MKHVSRFWNYYVRVCQSNNIDSDEMYHKGKEFLLYYRDACRMPGNLLAPDPYETAQEAIRQYEALEAILHTAGAGEVSALLTDRRLSQKALKEIMDETVNDFMNMGEEYRDYGGIINKKYMVLYSFTDTQLMEMMGMGSTTFYNKLREATGLFILHMWSAVIPRRCRELRMTVMESRLHPLEAIYG